MMFTTRVPMEKLKIEQLFKNEDIKYLAEAPKAPPKEIIKIDMLKWWVVQDSNLSPID